MNRLSLAKIACGIALASAAAFPAGAQRTEALRVQSALEVFRAITAVPEYQVPAALMHKAYGIAILPGVQRAGFIIGGQRGRGVLVVRAADGGWSRPLFITLTGGSVGWQAGIQSADIVLFFRTRDSVERVLRGKYTLGVDASLAAGSLGREASAVTDQDLKAEIYSYSRARGIFAGFALQGAAVDVDYDANSLYYGKEIARAMEVFDGAGLPDPRTAIELRQGIAQYEKTLR
ncbi:MAG: lipid-binding SYLF domain-containing protein [Spirochaetia bacterium]|jgi:lipid-binding SYLF domain-containing protein